MSRVTRWCFVTIDTGLRASASTSRQRRARRNRRSTGWYGSVTPLITSSCGSHRGEASSLRNNSGACGFTRMRLSKSNPAESPRYSCVGRA